jgi:hypothetical protein
MLLIGLGGLLLVVSHLFAISVSIFKGGVGEHQKDDYVLDVKNILAGSDTKHHWRCS